MKTAGLKTNLPIVAEPPRGSALPGNLIYLAFTGADEDVCRPRKVGNGRREAALYACEKRLPRRRTPRNDIETWIQNLNCETTQSGPTTSVGQNLCGFRQLFYAGVETSLRDPYGAWDFDLPLNQNQNCDTARREPTGYACVGACYNTGGSMSICSQPSLAGPYNDGTTSPAWRISTVIWPR